MSKLLKDEIDAKSIKKLAVLIKKHQAEFNDKHFEALVLMDSWPQLSLKQRIRKVTERLNECLALTFTQTMTILKPVSVNFNGLFHLIFADYVALYGTNDFEPSMDALALFTQNSSAEFAIRVFIEQSPERTKKQLLLWSKDPNEHLRRLASEGVRPRLPWATHITWIAEDPEWLRPIIENLKADSSRYVQKSVANLINDFSKTQNNWVLELCANWSRKASNETKWIIKHALRTLLKQGNPRALALIGYTGIDHVSVLNWQMPQYVEIGRRLPFEFSLSANQPLGLLRLEYAISFIRKHKPPYRKVFKIAESDYRVLSKVFSPNHNFKPISTRTYITGSHKFELIINGQVVKETQFELTAVN